MILHVSYISDTKAAHLYMRCAVQTVEKVKQKCLAFSLICGIINMVMKDAENRKTRKTSDRIGVLRNTKQYTH